MDSQIPLTKKERKEFYRQDRLETNEAFARKLRVKRIAWRWLGGGLTVALIGGLVWYVATRPSVPESEILSRNGLHWHTQLAVYVKGAQQEIPASIGIGAVHNPMHTHDNSGEIHLEVAGVVRKDSITLGKFMKVWGKNLTDFGPTFKMTVNGKENNESENYVLRNEDKVELRFD